MDLEFYCNDCKECSNPKFYNHNGKIVCSNGYCLDNIFDYSSKEQNEKIDFILKNKNITNPYIKLDKSFNKQVKFDSLFNYYIKFDINHIGSTFFPITKKIRGKLGPIISNPVRNKFTGAYINNTRLNIKYYFNLFKNYDKINITKNIENNANYIFEELFKRNKVYNTEIISIACLKAAFELDNKKLTEPMIYEVMNYEKIRNRKGKLIDNRNIIKIRNSYRNIMKNFFPIMVNKNNNKTLRNIIFSVCDYLKLDLFYNELIYKRIKFSMSHIRGKSIDSWIGGITYATTQEHGITFTQEKISELVQIQTTQTALRDRYQDFLKLYKKYSPKSLKNQK